LFLRINNWLFGAALIVAAIAIILDALSFPEVPGQNYGPALFPDIIAAGFILCGLALVIDGIRSRGLLGLVELGEWARSGGRIFDVAMICGGIVLLIALWDVVGFLIGATLLTGTCISRFRGGKIVTSFIFALVACLIIDMSFRRLLLVPLPLGPLDGIM
jgi:putative tricarboxylic transport membrane protein